MRTIAQPTVSVNLATSALQAANARLLTLRHTVANRGENHNGVGVSARRAEIRPIHHAGNQALEGERLLRQRRLERANRQIEQPRGAGSFFVTPAISKEANQSDEFVDKAVLRMYPDLLLGMLREEVVAIGRIWLLCRHLDREGRGWLDLAFIRDMLTGKNSPLKVVGKRRLRQILADGAKEFWERDDAGRLWLYGVARVAVMLGVERLGNRPIALPVADLVAGLAQTRAHCYAAFHSGRNAASNGELANPISRATLTDLCGVSERTQRRYDQLAGVEKQPCIAIGQLYDIDNHAETTWQQRGTFKLTDYRGLHGQAGTTYTAWQLPNQYHSCHDRLPKGRQRKLNLQLRLLTHHHADLVTQRARGNDLVSQKDRSEQIQFARRFFANGGEMSKARLTNSVYWFDRVTSNTTVWIPLR